MLGSPLKQFSVTVLVSCPEKGKHNSTIKKKSESHSSSFSLVRIQENVLSFRIEYWDYADNGIRIFKFWHKLLLQPITIIQGYCVRMKDSYKFSIQAPTPELYNYKIRNISEY